jgi:hypothetical protein
MVFEIFVVFFFIYIFFMLYYRYRSINYDINPRPKIFRVDQRKIRFFYDVTWYEEGKGKSDRTIVDNVIQSITRAKKSIVLDIGLKGSFLRSKKFGRAKCNERTL